jgi:antibiotic biosynthesis monooxygenase (ABM) superfamily enzyme
MKFRLELTINKPRAEMWKVFDNPENMCKWQHSLTKFELVNRTQRQPDTVSKLTYEEDGCDLFTDRKGRLSR